MANPISTLLTEIKAAEQEALTKAFNDFANSYEQLTFGPDENSLAGSYTAGKGAWDLHFVDKLNSDVLLMMQSRLAQFCRRTNQPNQSGPIKRRVKDLLLKDYFPVHVIGDLG